MGYFLSRKMEVTVSHSADKAMQVHAPTGPGTHELGGSDTEAARHTPLDEQNFYDCT